MRAAVGLRGGTRSEEGLPLQSSKNVVGLGAPTPHPPFPPSAGRAV